MTHKKIILICSIAIFLFALVFFWNNALIIDDFHPSDKMIQYIPINNIPQSHNETDPLKTEKSGVSTPETDNMLYNKGYHLHINLDEYLMYVYKDGEYIKTYPVSGGKASTPTPLGTWRIIGKATWGEGFGGAWLAINVPWGKYGIHGTVYPWCIGRSNLSKGCIRMKNSDVKQLYRLVPYGTTVTIVQENRKIRNLRIGNIGSDVKEMQVALKKLGYYKGYPDGKFGRGVKNSVIKFQKDNKIWQSGIINRQTYNLIIKLSNT